MSDTMSEIVGCDGARAAVACAGDSNSTHVSNLKNGRFVNTMKTKTIPEGNPVKVMWDFLFNGSDNRVPEEYPRVEKLNYASFIKPGAKTKADNLRLTWLGHAAMLIELEGAILLTDPMLADRASPVGWAGPKRFYEAPVSVQDLPYVDAVLISHDHYDHLDKKSIQQLMPRVGRFIVPMGLKATLTKWGVDATRVDELNWWEEARVGQGVRVVLTPARHFSGRGLINRNKTLWGGFAVLGREHRVFFSGDSGYGEHFQEIGEKFGPFDASFMDSGAYNESWANVHMNPEEAVQAHLDVRANVYIPVHWGTFDLSLHSWTEPVERTLLAAHVAHVQLAVPRPGQSVRPGAPGALNEVQPWWRESEDNQEYARTQLISAEAMVSK